MQRESPLTVPKSYTPLCSGDKAAPVKDHTVEDLGNLFATNVGAPFFVAQQLLPQLGDVGSISSFPRSQRGPCLSLIDQLWLLNHVLEMHYIDRAAQTTKNKPRSVFLAPARLRSAQ